MKAAIQKGNYSEAAQIAGKETLDVAGKTAEMAYTAASTATKMTVDTLSQVDYKGLGKKACAMGSSVGTSIYQLGMTFYSNLPSKEQVAKTSGQLMQASSDFWQDMCGQGSDKKEETPSETPSVRM